MKTNTELLMGALGWQGGTIHQVAAETGLKQMDILNLRELKIKTVKGLESYNAGLSWGMSAPHSRNKHIPKEAKGDNHFWAGVMDYFSK